MCLGYITMWFMQYQFEIELVFKEEDMYFVKLNLKAFIKEYFQVSKTTDYFEFDQVSKTIPVLLMQGHQLEIHQSFINNYLLNYTNYYFKVGNYNYYNLVSYSQGSYYQYNLFIDSVGIDFSSASNFNFDSINFPFHIQFMDLYLVINDSSNYFSFMASIQCQFDPAFLKVNDQLVYSYYHKSFTTDLTFYRHCTYQVNLKLSMDFLIVNHFLNQMYSLVKSYLMDYINCSSYQRTLFEVPFQAIMLTMVVNSCQAASCSSYFMAFEVYFPYRMYSLVNSCLMDSINCSSYQRTLFEVPFQVIMLTMVINSCQAASCSSCFMAFEVYIPYRMYSLVNSYLMDSIDCSTYQKTLFEVPFQVIALTMVVNSCQAAASCSSYFMAFEVYFPYCFDFKQINCLQDNYS